MNPTEHNAGPSANEPKPEGTFRQRAYAALLDPHIEDNMHKSIEKWIGILIVAYNAATTLAKVFRRIPPVVWDNVEEVVVFDDASQDETFELALGYKAEGMTAYSRLQQAEFAAESKGYTATRHQHEVGTGYFDAVADIIGGGHASTLAMTTSTERGQF